MFFKFLIPLILLAAGIPALAMDDHYELKTDWKCLPSTQTTASGETISNPSFALDNWKPAVVPGTVLTTQLANGEIPDPFYGMNNEKIPDIHATGREYYTYWFVKDFRELPPKEGGQVWLTFRGINYSCDIFLNGHKVNAKPYRGMFLRKTFNITDLLKPGGVNRLAVIVYPPDHVGNPNGGQGGDGRIARNLTHQYVAGWDWIQPIRDRNTGIWDKVILEKTGRIRIKEPHIVTRVPGVRKPSSPQENAFMNLSAELENPTGQTVRGTLACLLGNKQTECRVEIPPNSTVQAKLPEIVLENPKLWWPTGYGPQNMYTLRLEFRENGQLSASDVHSINFGVRELDTAWNERTRSREMFVNGQRLFIRGGNWIISDAMLRFSPERYDAEIRYHRDMNLNLIRIWGGALTERPEFYEACDRYGLLVMQDFWFSGDCNGRWRDALKADDQWTRRKYPDDHALVLEAAEDMVKMIRNHPSLAAWCGGNEIPPPSGILDALRNRILPSLDGTRWFIDYSNSCEMSYNSLGGNGDGPYRIQPISTFWQEKTWPFNSEIGSIGVGDYESLERFIPEDSMIVPTLDPTEPFGEKVNDVWTYHKYTGVGYEDHLIPYGPPSDVRDFTRKAQLVNYEQYRAIMEGFSSHMWDWYTGFIIWKTQNPWTAMRGQMYDYYLDPNACLFGTRKGGEPLHAMCNPVTGEVMVVNNGLEPARDVMLVVRLFNTEGKEKKNDQVFCYVNASNCLKIMSLSARIKDVCRDKGGFLLLQLMDADGKLISDNFYWFPNQDGQYSGLRSMSKADLQVTATSPKPGTVIVRLTAPKEGGIAFFNRISLVDAKSGKRIMPAFYQDNYVSLVPGSTREIPIDYIPGDNGIPAVTVEGWNVDQQTILPTSPQL